MKSSYIVVQVGCGYCNIFLCFFNVQSNIMTRIVYTDPRFFHVGRYIFNYLYLKDLRYKYELLHIAHTRPYVLEKKSWFLLGNFSKEFCHINSTESLPCKSTYYLHQHLPGPKTKPDPVSSVSFSPYPCSKQYVVKLSLNLVQKL